MRNVTLALIILCVSSTHTKWKRKVCEEEYNFDWCLDTFSCVMEFLNCNCVPLAAFVGSDDFPDTLSLCMMAYAWGVSEPECCSSNWKRSRTSSISDDDISTDDSVLSLILETVEKRNFDKRVEEILNNDGQSKSADKRTNRLSKTIANYPVSESSVSGTPDVYLNSVSEPVISGTDTGLYSLQEEAINARSNAKDKSDSALTNNANIYSKHKSRATRMNSLSRRKSRVKGTDKAYQTSVQKSSFRSLDNTYPGPSSLQKSSAIVNENADALETLAKLSDTDKLNDSIFRSKLLRVLKCYVDRD